MLSLRLLIKNCRKDSVCLVPGDILLKNGFKNAFMLNVYHLQMTLIL